MTTACGAVTAPAWPSVLDELSRGWAAEDVLSMNAADPAAAPAARHYTRAVLTDWGMEPGLRADAELAVSELVSNSIQAAKRYKLPQARIGLRLLAQPGHLVVAVWDSAPQAPRYRTTSPTRPHGRGLQVISAVSRGWGYLLCPNGGKTVYAMFEP